MTEVGVRTLEEVLKRIFSQEMLYWVLQLLPGQISFQVLQL